MQESGQFDQVRDFPFFSHNKESKNGHTRADTAAQGIRSLLPSCPDIFEMAALLLGFSFLGRSKGEEQMSKDIWHYHLPFSQEEVAFLDSLSSDFSLCLIG